MIFHIMNILTEISNQDDIYTFVSMVLFGLVKYTYRKIDETHLYTLILPNK